MTETASKKPNSLLARGGLCLGMAAAARACGETSDSWKCHTLSPELEFATRQILSALEDERDMAVVQRSLYLAMGDIPATKAPKWAALIAEAPEWLDILGQTIEPLWSPGNNSGENSDRAKGYACVAIALCRSLDAGAAFANLLDLQQDKKQFMSLLYLAAVSASPGEPGAMRDKIAAVLSKEKESLWEE